MIRHRPLLELPVLSLCDVVPPGALNPAGTVCPPPHTSPTLAMPLSKGGLPVAPRMEPWFGLAVLPLCDVLDLRLEAEAAEPFACECVQSSRIHAVCVRRWNVREWRARVPLGEEKEVVE